MIEDQTIKQIIARITLITATSADWCFNQPLEDLLDFFKVLCEEAEKLRKEAASSGK
ncbi:MAG: hypothetical protein DIU64_003110 [Caldicoprobacter oshimai]